MIGLPHTGLITKHTYHNDPAKYNQGRGKCLNVNNTRRHKYYFALILENVESYNDSTKITFNNVYFRHIIAAHNNTDSKNAKDIKVFFCIKMKIKINFNW